MNNTTNKNQESGVCQQCGKHCPLDALSCGKGRSFYGIDSDQGNNEHFDKKESYEGREGREGRGGHGKHREHEGRGGHGNHGDHRDHGGYGKHEGHGNHGKHKHFENDSSLFGLLRQCGHFLYFKGNGGKQFSQNKILQILSENGSMGQKDLQDGLGVKAGSLSEILQKLEHKNLIERIKDENDKRKVLVSITESGKMMIHEQEKLTEENDLFSVLETEEQEELSLLLKKLLSSWNTDNNRESSKEGKPAVSQEPVAEKEPIIEEERVEDKKVTNLSRQIFL